MNYLGFPLGRTSEGGQEYRIAVLTCHVLHSADHLGYERVSDRSHHDAECTSLACDQTSRGSADTVAGCPRDLLDPLRGFAVH